MQQFKKQPFRLNSHSRGDLVLEGVGRDPVGAFEENWLPIDSEIKAQSWRPDNWLLDQFHRAEIHLQGTLHQTTDLYDLVQSLKHIPYCKTVILLMLLFKEMNLRHFLDFLRTTDTLIPIKSYS